MSFGKEIKRLRELAGITSEKMAEVLGINGVEKYRNWEKRDTNPKFPDLNNIEQIFEMSLEEIMNLQALPQNVIDKANGKIVEPEAPSYIEKRRQLKNNKKNILTYYDIGAKAGTEADILPVKKNEGVLYISDLFRGSQFAIRISGNSMIPSYPLGAIIGIREVQDKQITPGEVYVIESGNELKIKRLFYKDDNQDTGIFQCISDNTMEFEKGPRKGQLYYPSVFVAVDNVRRLFLVTGIYKSNELTVIQ